MSEMQHNCLTKTAMSGVAGFGLGGVFGMFMASVRCLSPTTTTHKGREAKENIC